MEETPNDLFDLLEDRALGGAGTDAKHGGNRSDAEPNGGSRTAEFQDYWQARIEANRIAERSRRMRRTDASFDAGRRTETGAGRHHGGEEVATDEVRGDRARRLAADRAEEMPAADDEPGMTIDEAIAVFLGSLGLMRDATEGDRRVTLAAG